MALTRRQSFGWCPPRRYPRRRGSRGPLPGGAVRSSGNVLLTRTTGIQAAQEGLGTVPIFVRRKWDCPPWSCRADPQTLRPSPGQDPPAQRRSCVPGVPGRRPPATIAQESRTIGHRLAERDHAETIRQRLDGHLRQRQPVAKRLLPTGLRQQPEPRGEAGPGQVAIDQHHAKARGDQTPCNGQHKRGHALAARGGAPSQPFRPDCRIPVRLAVNWSKASPAAA